VSRLLGLLMLDKREREEGGSEGGREWERESAGVGISAHISAPSQVGPDTKLETERERAGSAQNSLLSLIAKLSPCSPFTRDRERRICTKLSHFAIRERGAGESREWRQKGGSGRETDRERER
jgi:hypothetical protein